MKYCKLCIQPDTRPNTVFESDGTCPACNYFRQLATVDWDERLEILRKLIVEYRPKSKSRHDCVLGVSGGKDSLRQALFLRDKLGANPLLVCLTYSPQQITTRGTDNLSNLIEKGFDLVISQPAPETWRQLMKDSFFKFTNYFRSTEAALFSSVPQLAIKYGIPLVFWGENPGLQLGDLATLGKTGYDGNNLRNLNTLSSGTEWMEQRGYSNSQLIPYRYPGPDEFEKHGIQIVYLGWFLGDWSFVNNALYSCAEGLEIRSDTVENTGDLFGVTALDEEWIIPSMMIKYYKYGFGRVTDYANEEIRLGRMSRQRGIELAELYDHSCGANYVHSFCDYVGISVENFWAQVHSSVNPELFEIRPDGSIAPRFKVGVGL